MDLCPSADMVFTKHRFSHRNPSITNFFCREDIVIFEKNLFLSYSEWSPKLKDLLSSNTKIMAFQRRAYALYKERFAPGKLGGDHPPKPRLCVVVPGEQ